MRQSKLFTGTEKSSPKDEVALNAKLLTRAGFIRKISAGVYAYLPLGWRVIEKINKIVREEMNKIGGQELFMPALVEKKYMEATKRWDIDVGFRVRGLGDEDDNFTLGWTHEEVLTAIAAKFVSSYKDLPFAAYQIQTKFRNEPRAQSGLLRGREFLMKDLYSFHDSEEDLFRYYEKVKEAYFNVFTRCGLEAVCALASGGAFTISNTHEFQILADIGEDTIMLCPNCRYAENIEISKLKEGDKCEKCGGEIVERKSIEVGNIFPLGTKYSEAFNLKFKDKNGNERFVVMGSYGIGIGRLMGTIVETKSDDKGMVWPESVSPYNCHLLDLGGGDEGDSKRRGEEIYEYLQKSGLEVLYDDRSVSAGEKFFDADLIGIPWRLVVSHKNKGKIEAKRRDKEETRIVDKEDLVKILAPNT